MRLGLYSYAFVAAGGAIGATARFTLELLLQRDVDFPWATLAANLLGCLIMGVIAQLVASADWFNNAGLIPDQYRLFFAVGFCSSFTTLSSVMLELNSLLQKDEIFYSFSYLVGTLIGGFACFYVGIVCVRTLMQMYSS